ncbi:MAG: RNase III inhibitor [delta proteobacterium ML8_F1]|nr:MAG: RNase III inhibitor [delta proteobacterium ML8_F1]
MPFQIIRADITKIQVEAIVNAANESLLGGSGVDGAIHRAAGPGLLEECRGLKGCRTGEAKITGGYRLPAKYVIHTVGPVYEGGGAREEELLRSCYRQSLELARAHGIGSIAFPLVSSGAYGYPKDQAIRTALSVFSEFLMSCEMDIFLVVYDKTAYTLSEKLFHSVKAYIDESLVVEKSLDYQKERLISLAKLGPLEEPKAVYQAAGDLDTVVSTLESTFSQRLFELIDQKGREDVEIYKRANVDRKLFSKIKCNPDYKPGKATALALAIALELSLEETIDLIGRAGYALSRSRKFDRIIEYFITRGQYDIFLINNALFDFDQPQLGV